MKLVNLLLVGAVASANAFQFGVGLSTKTQSTSAVRLNAESRREFLQSAASTAVAAPLLLNGAPALAEETSKVGGAIDLPPIGLGAWSWGDSIFWGYNKKNDDELKQVFDYAVENSPTSTTLLDTAELYGLGRSETLIGEFSQPYDPNKIQVATKFAAYPFRTKPDTVVKACEASVKRLGRPIDLYQIHFPNAYCNAEYWDGLAMAYDKGLVKAVGVSNYGVDATRACHDALAKRGIQLATNQIQLSLLYRWPIENGLLQCCEDLGVKVLSYSPLALGMLTGKYTASNPPSGPRKAIFQKLSASPDYQNLLNTMKDVAAGHGDNIPLSQVALNWTRAKNTIPIPGARTLSQVQKNYGSLSWTLTPEEVKVLDESAAKVTAFIKPEENPFPKVDKDTGLIMYDS